MSISCVYRVLSRRVHLEVVARERVVVLCDDDAVRPSLRCLRTERDGVGIGPTPTASCRTCRENSVAQLYLSYMLSECTYMAIKWLV